jgi:uncharacterized spore protein YtfJ
MGDVETLLKTITGEMQKSMTSKSVVGDPITIQDTTLIPLISIGMGFGAGIGAGKGREEGEGSGGGGGLGIKPVAVVVIDKSGVKVELLKEARPSAIEKLAEAAPKIAEAIPKIKEKQGAEKES